MVSKKHYVTTSQYMTLNPWVFPKVRVTAPCTVHTWERTKIEETQDGVKGWQIKNIQCTELNKVTQGKASLPDEPDGCSWSGWCHPVQTVHFNYRNSVVDVSKKRHNSWRCDLWQRAGLASASHSWILCVFVLLPRSWRQAAAALCWASCGLTHSCCGGGGAGWRTIWDVALLHFGRCGTARATAAVAATAMLAVLALPWAGAARPRLHEDNGAVIFWAEVRAVRRADIEAWSGKLDLRMDNREDKSGRERTEYEERAATCPRWEWNRFKEATQQRQCVWLF